jgi:hypothetical protein
MEMTFGEAVVGIITGILFDRTVRRRVLVLASFLFFGGAIFLSLPDTYFSWFIFFVYSLYAACGIMRVWEEID